MCGLSRSVPRVEYELTYRWYLQCWNEIPEMDLSYFMSVVRTLKVSESSAAGPDGSVRTGQGISARRVTLSLLLRSGWKDPISQEFGAGICIFLYVIIGFECVGEEGTAGWCQR